MWVDGGEGANFATAPGSRVGVAEKFSTKLNNLKENFNFLHSTNFKFLSRIYGNARNNCDFFKFLYLLGVVIVTTRPGRLKKP